MLWDLWPLRVDYYILREKFMVVHTSCNGDSVDVNIKRRAATGHNGCIKSMID